MSEIYKKVHPETKDQLHPNNKHRERYDFKALIITNPALASYVSKNKYGDESIDFFKPAAVTCLNQTLLQHFYDIQNWSIPDGYLCPPIPGRADYIHHIAELLGNANGGEIPIGKDIKCLDVGVGANCVYPIIGTKEYGWSFVGSDIDPISIASANQIIENNSFLKGKMTLRLQKQPNAIFSDIIEKDERFDLTICNPPFHASAKEAAEGSMRKLSNLKRKKATKATLNFGGQKNELWCDGGETRFVGNMLQESKIYADSCLWFSSLISKQANLNIVYKQLEALNPSEIHTIAMKQGNKISRLLVWTFHSKAAQQNWMNERWK